MVNESKSMNANSNLTEEQKNVIEHIQVSRNEAISKELCAAQTFEQQMAVLIRSNRHNHLAIFDFLKSLQNEPFDSFLFVLQEAIEKIDDQDEQVRLLVGLCGLYNGQKLKPTIDLCGKLLSYLSNQDGVTTQQALGFLKYTFITKGNIHESQLSDIQEFDKRHKQCFVGFKQWLQWTFKMPNELSLIMPHSCCILGTPFAKRLRKCSSTFTEHIPSSFQQIIVQVLVYTFDQNDSPFEQLCETMKMGFRKYIEKIDRTKFVNLFNMLLEEIKNYNPIWYKNMKGIQQLLTGCLEMIKEGKIKVFELDLCKKFINKVESPEQYLSAPTILKDQSNYEKENQLKQFYTLNQQNSSIQKLLPYFDPNQLHMNDLCTIFKSLNIAPHFIQELSSKFFLYTIEYPHKFINMGPGLGKTKLILAWSIYLFQKYGKKVIILNNNKTLLERDFNQALPFLEQLKIDCDIQVSNVSQIVFMTVKDFLKSQNHQDYCVLLDEYQNVFFNENLIFECRALFSKAFQFVALSGSPINSAQHRFLEKFFGDSLVAYFTEPNRFESQVSTVCNTQKIHIELLIKEGLNHYKKTPIVYILNNSLANAIIKRGKNLPFINLITKPPSEINTILQTIFNQPRDDGTYGLFLIDEEMGTGTDFLTSSAIESNGGLVLIFAIKPSNSSSFEQMNCRVGRIFNKAQRYFIIQDNHYKGSGQDYLRYQLSIIKQQEIKEAKQLLRQLDDGNSTVISDNNSKYRTYSHNDKEQNFLSSQANDIVQDNFNNNDIPLFKDKQTFDLDSQQETKYDDKVTNTVNLSKSLNLGKRRPCISVNSLQEEIKESVSKIAAQEGEYRITTFNDECQFIKKRKSSRLAELIIPKGFNSYIERGYRQSYSNFEIHDIMSNDHARCAMYEKAIQMTVKDKIILDIGAGSGILSIFAAQHGATKVYAIEAAALQDIANRKIKDANVENKVEYISAMMENVDSLPLVDVIISEWMGYFLLYERMLPSVLNARRFLKEGGTIIPQAAEVLIGAGQWNEPFPEITKAYVKPCNEQMLLSEKQSVCYINLLTCDDNFDRFTAQFELLISKEGKLSCIIGWFDVFLNQDVTLSTSPVCEQTHWNQTVLFLKNELEVTPGDKIVGSMKVEPGKPNYRSLEINMEYGLRGTQPSLMKNKTYCQRFIME